MSENNFNVNINVNINENTAKIAQLLIEKISNGGENISKGISTVYSLFDSTDKSRKAKDNAETNKINLISDLEMRTIKRVYYENEKEQLNIENIVLLASQENIITEENIDNVNTDLCRNIIRQGKYVSDKEMQSMWARILAGEIAKPGSFSKRTVNALADFDKRDAELFTKLVQFVLTLQNKAFLFFFHMDDFFNKIISFDDLLHLESMDVIKIDFLGKFTLQSNYYFKFEYYGKFVKINSISKKDLSTGSAIFTNLGHELFKICTSEKNENFFDYMIDRFKKQDFEILECNV